MKTSSTTNSAAPARSQQTATSAFLRPQQQVDTLHNLLLQSPWHPAPPLSFLPKTPEETERCRMSLALVLDEALALIDELDEHLEDNFDDESQIPPSQ